MSAFLTPTGCEIPADHSVPGGGEQHVAHMAALFQGFADPTRLRLLNALAAGELCVCDLVALLDMPQPAISRHLAYLRRMGVVEAARSRKFAHYRLVRPTSVVHGNLIACVRSCFVGVPQLHAEREKAAKLVQMRAAAPCL